MSGDRFRDIRDLDRKELEQFFLDHGEKKFRGTQVHEWIWRRWCSSFEQMTNLPKPLRLLLAASFTFNRTNISLVQRSSDGTVKVAFALFDGLPVEGVLIPSGQRYTACISSQAGCALGCRFCATGRLGFKRNLNAPEILDQVVHLAKLAGAEQQTGSASQPVSDNRQADQGEVSVHPLSNIVFMGMGEPLQNYVNVTHAISQLTSPEGFGFSPQRITVSSVGLPVMIRKMADDDPKYQFALSLHAASDAKRDRLIPLNTRNNIGDLVDALKYYHQKTRKRISIEYILFRNFNDTREDAVDLARFCRNFPVKINLMEYNRVDDTGLYGSPPEKVKAFVEMMQRYNLVVNVRKSRGIDISAACGQLAGRPADAKA
jgi:23S rRNA (adenine2503-C2)-methyltransferase